jgi:hypothetical protein
MKEESVYDVPSPDEAVRWATYVMSHPEQADWSAEEAFAAYRKEFPEAI